MCKIYNMVEKREHGTLMHHDGTVTALAVHETTHVVTASDDNSLAIIRTGNWQVRIESLVFSPTCLCCNLQYACAMLDHGHLSHNMPML